MKDPYQIASEWHGGQFTELYKLQSSGKIDSKRDCLSEIDECLAGTADPLLTDELYELRDFVESEFADETEEE